MRAKYDILLLIFGIFGACYCKPGFRGDQEWGFVNVRREVYMFYWLHYTTANVSSYFDKPLIIWLQGGPGISSTGYGNFAEIGPFNMDLNSRKHTLVKYYNILFIDSPVETGYSFVNLRPYGSIATTDNQITNDLFKCIDGFFKNFSNFTNIPVYIVGQSYGAKVTVNLALKWLQNKNPNITTGNLKGIALGSAWVSPIDSVSSMGSYLKQKNLIDNMEYRDIMKETNNCKHFITTESWMNASYSSKLIRQIIFSAKIKTNLYNILSEDNERYYETFEEVDKIIKNLMNSHVKPALNLPLTLQFKIKQPKVTRNLGLEIMKPVAQKVEQILNISDIRVHVFNGELDAVVPSIGTEEWIKKLKWKYAENWSEASKRSLIINKIKEGKVQSYRNFRMYWIDRAGHEIAIDNPSAMMEIMRRLTRDQ